MPGLITRIDRFPSWLRRFVYRIAEGRGILGRCADVLRFRFAAVDVPRAPKISPAPIRLFIGPANSAGQGYRWARSVETNLPETSAMSMQGLTGGVFRPEIDLRVPTAVYLRAAAWHDDLERYLREQTHVIWESGLPLLGRRYRGGAAGEITEFRSHGVAAALLFHGSDIRPPSRHAVEEPWSPFPSHVGPVNAIEDMVARNMELIAESGAPVFVSTPDLLRWVPSATWCPVTVDLKAWRSSARRTPRGRPVVAHAPSQAWLKGTDLIEPTLHRLDDEGVIDYRTLVGVTHAEMPSFYAEADIVLDQFTLGIYGVAACEAMAAGKLVMSHVDDITRRRVLDATGRELPIHETTADTLEADLRRFAAQPEALSEQRDAGPEFVEAVHDGRMSARALAPFLGFSA